MNDISFSTGKTVLQENDKLLLITDLKLPIYTVAEFNWPVKEPERTFP